MAPVSCTNGIGKNYEMADLEVVSYQRLRGKDEIESAKLFNACTESGFFYLDLADPKDKPYCKTVEASFALSKEYFTRPLEEKLNDKREELSALNVCGFKPLGSLGLDAGNIENKKNGCEHLRIPADALFNPSSDPRLYCPAGVKEHWELLKDFLSDSHDLANTILESLSGSLGLRNGNRFEDYHKTSAPSTSIAALQYYPSTDLPEDTSAGHFAHTDVGSLTVLFNSDWGLQAYYPEANAWKLVAPLEHCAIINVGDSLRFLSNFKLQSSLHRVVPWQRPASSPRGPRYASIYFLRASNDTRFVDSEGKEWTASKWLERKFQNYRVPHKEQESNAITTGRKGFTGLVETAQGMGVEAK